jgi:hypothetical protein
MDLVNFAGFDTYIATNNCAALASSQSESDDLQTKAANPAYIVVPCVAIAVLIAIVASRNRASEISNDGLDTIHDHQRPHYYPHSSFADMAFQQGNA